LQLLPAAEIDAFEVTFAFPIRAVVAVPVQPEQSAAPLVQFPARPVQITPGDGEKEAASGNVKMLFELVWQEIGLTERPIVLVGPELRPLL
jgi:hypothetical protein